MQDKDFPLQEYENRWTLARSLMEERGLDALLVTERNNYRYFTGHQTGQFGNKMRPMLFLLPREGKPVMMIYGLESLKAKEQTWIEDIRSYVDVPFPTELVTDTLKDLGLSRGKIGCELGENQRMWLPFTTFEEIRGGLPEASFVDASAVYVRCRMRKSALELERMQKACAITELAYEVVLQRVHPGLTIRQVKDLCLRALVDAGSEPLTPGFVLLDVVGLGDDYVYKKGDSFFCDFGGSYKGYKADFSRLATFGKPTDQQRKNHEEIVHIIDAVIGGMRPGVRACDIAQICNRELQAIGFPPLQGTKRIGHGCGLDVQEPPSLNAADATVLEPGIVLTPEPRFIRDGVFVMVEEDVVITPDGVRRLSTGSEKLRVIDV